MLQRIVTSWKERTAGNEEERHKRKAAMSHMTGYRMLHIIKAWFNQIDVLKHERVIQRDVLQSRISRLKRQYFVVWLSKYL